MRYPIISIIIPVYNVEQWLRQCIDSILIQSFTNFELLLIDDGSTDKSNEICDKYAKTDNRIIAHHKPNGGVSSARNFGIDHARGEFIIFVDADDYWIDCKALETLYSKIYDNNLDIIRGDYISVDYAGTVIEYAHSINKQIYQDQILSAGEFIKNIISGEFFLVLALIRKSIINDIRFDTTMVFLEDMKIFVEILNKNPKCSYINLPFYAYRKLESSASSVISTKRLENSFAMCDFFWEISNRSSDSEFSSFCKYNSVMIYYWTLQTLASDSYYSNRKSIIAELGLRDLQNRTTHRCKSLNLSHKYLPFIKSKPAISVMLLHYKDWVRAKLS